ncbi:MAG: glycosyltransferase [Firmicutes bacterium]|nr:glycosyltransferase [Bacillota bacterium]
MKILYFATTMVQEDFDRLAAKSKSAPNPSNQNFHHKLIKALALYNDVEVIVNRPINYHFEQMRRFSYETKKEGNIRYHYVSFINERFLKPFTFNLNARKIARKIFRKKDDVILVVDSLNYSSVRVAQSLGIFHKVPIIGIITDDPSNLSSVNKKFVARINRTLPYYDMYLTLTEELNKMANPFGNPHYTFSGLVEDSKMISYENNGKSLFFGGSIYERYGISNLLSAFRNLPGDYNLLIAGQGPDVPLVTKAAKSDPRVVYLGLLTPRELIKYEHTSILNINPRPFDADIDLLSIPSKVLEYAESGTPTLSTISTPLMTDFANEIMWAGNGKAEELFASISKFLEMSPSQRKALGDAAREKALELFSIENQGAKINHFIKSNK